MSRYEQLEKSFREQRLRLLRKVVFVSLGGVILFGALALPSIIAGSHEIVGTAIAQYGEITDAGTIPYLIVRVNDGQIISAHYDVTIPFRRDRQVVIKEVTTMFFGYKRYKFVRYLDVNQEASTGRTP
jgi:hypothetical protein